MRDRKDVLNKLNMQLCILFHTINIFVYKCRLSEILSFPRNIESHSIYKQNQIKLPVVWMSSGTIFNTPSTVNHPTSESSLTANLHRNKTKLPIHLSIDGFSNTTNIACTSSGQSPHMCPQLVHHIFLRVKQRFTVWPQLQNLPKLNC